MTDTPHNTRRQRLIKARWLRVEGWLPEREAKRVRALLARHAEESERIAETGQPGRGRPRKERGETGC